MSQARRVECPVYDDALAITDGIGTVASADPSIPLPSDPEALLWLIQHVHDVWKMRLDEKRMKAHG